MNKYDQLIEAIQEIAKTQVEMAKCVAVLTTHMVLISSSFTALAKEAEAREERWQIEAERKDRQIERAGGST